MMLSKLHYFPMEEVKGYVILDATSTFKPHEVKLRFIGQERTLGSKSDPPMQLHSLFNSEGKPNCEAPTVQTQVRRSSQCLSMGEKKYNTEQNLDLDF